MDKHRSLFTLAPRADVNFKYGDEEQQRSSVDLQQGRVRMLQDDTPKFMIVVPYLIFDDLPLASEPLPVEQDLLNFYSVVGDVLRASGALFRR